VKRFTSETQKIGEKGEDIAVMFLVKHGFSVIERNYTKKCGEVDIVAQKDSILHFVEVKTLKKVLSHVKHREYSPFENINAKKFRKFTNTCQIYLFERKVPRETPWQVDVIGVLIDQKTGETEVNILENIIVN